MVTYHRSLLFVAVPPFIAPSESLTVGVRTISNQRPEIVWCSLHLLVPRQPLWAFPFTGDDAETVAVGSEAPLDPERTRREVGDELVGIVDVVVPRDGLAVR